jgi:UDPglucose 6-dehydrogenase
VGIPDPGAKEPIIELYAPIISSGTPVAFMSRRSAELVKYASNAFLAMKVTYANELADLCEKVGANIQDVVLGMGYDERIGNQYLRVGPGFGGSCFPKDISALLHLAGQHGARLELLAATDRANRRRIESMSERIVAALDGYPEKRTVCALGLTFKAGTGDLRDSPAVSILRSLTQTGANVVVYDPVTRGQERCDLGGLKLADDAYDAARDADLLIILTEWAQFRELHLPTLKKLMRRPSILDLRNVLGRAAAREHGFRYSSLGDGELR